MKTAMEWAHFVYADLDDRSGVFDGMDKETRSEVREMLRSNFAMAMRGERNLAYQDFIEAVDAMKSQARHSRNEARARGDTDMATSYSADARVLESVISKCKLLRGDAQ